MMETQTQLNQGMATEALEPRKYLFDLAFDKGLNKKTDAREKPKPTFTQEQLEAEKRTSYEQGYNAGQKAMMEDQQQYANVLLSQIDRKLAHVMEESLGEWQRQLTQLQEIALVITRKIMPTYVERYGMDEIETIVAKVIAEVGHEPRLVFRVNESLFEDVSARINAVAAGAAYAGKLVILGDPELGTSDCRIEWADGGIERDLKTLWQDIGRVMEEVQTFESTMMEPNEEPTPASTPIASPQAIAQQPIPDAGEKNDG